MAIQARVTSTEALELFRAKLIIFLNKARVNVDDVSDEVRRTRAWLQQEQPQRWEGEIRRRAKQLDQAQSDLRNAEFAGNQEATKQSRQAVVNRAKQLLTEAEDKLRRVKKWNQNYDNVSDPYVKKLESFRQIVTEDLPKAIAHLRNIQKALEAYAETGGSLPDSGTAPESAPGEQGAPVEAAPSTEPPVT
jgi:predicted DNA-binding protein YlxM (UPF0122 family)